MPKRETIQYEATIAERLPDLQRRAELRLPLFGCLHPKQIADAKRREKRGNLPKYVNEPHDFGAELLERIRGCDSLFSAGDGWCEVLATTIVNNLCPKRSQAGDDQRDLFPGTIGRVLSFLAKKCPAEVVKIPNGKMPAVYRIRREPAA